MMAVWSETNIIEISQNKRIDSEFFHPEYISAENLVSEVGNTSYLGFLGQFVIGPFGSAFHVDNYDSNEQYRYIRGKDVKPFQLKNGDNVYLPKKDFERLKKYSICEDDLIISVVGTLGNVAIIPKNETGIFSCKSTLFRNSSIDPYYLLAYLNSKYGHKCLLRRQRGAIQTGLNKDDLKTVPVPIFSDATHSCIGELIRKALKLYFESEGLYTKAQKLLEKELALEKMKFENPVGYEARFSDIVFARRIDSQCYRSEYINYEKYLREHSQIDDLKNLVESPLKGKQMAVSSDGALNYASIKDIQGLELISDSFCHFSSDTRIADKGDLLLAITGATIGKIGIVDRYDRLAFSGDLLGLRVKNAIDPFYLLAVMQSPIGQSQCKRWITGSTNGHLAPEDVGKIVIPRLGNEKEQLISEKIKGSLKAKGESETLLEKAKNRVEELIEQAAEQSPA